MYVAELAIPWEESPFMFQGFKLKSWEDVDTVIEHCRHVTVDFKQTQILKIPRNEIGDQRYSSMGKIQRSASTQQEITRANKTYKHASGLVHNMMDDIRLGKAIDTKAAKEVVSDAVDSIIRTPDAMMMLTTIKNRDEYTAEHSLNVAVLTIAFGRALNMERERLEELGVCGLLHDMGKVLTPDEVLLKEDRLTEEEFQVMKKHPTNGRDIIAGSGGNFPGAMDVAHSHHERIDGHGYPRGLYEHQMTLWSKIVSITDAFDAITSNRCYQDGRSNMEAFRIMNKARGKQFDADLVMRFIGAIGIYPPGSIVKLNTGESGVVVEANPKSSLLPKVLIVRDAIDQVLEPRLIDLADKVKTPLGNEFYKIITTLKRSETSIDVHELKEKNFLLTEI
jgi:HD-GYP domain-containing protein (c-di-GMP phosphodiesterase class II)